jgi:DNA (cytosine-5)-methyltransferase 1
MSNKRPEVVDLFCGVGALSHGLKLAGCKIVAGYDVDSRCKYAFETNNDATFYPRDVSQLDASEISAHFSGAGPSVLAGCAPCQPFSTYKQRYDEDPQWGLVRKFAEIAVEVAPDFVTMENVPALLRYKGGYVFEEFKSLLESAGYRVSHTVAECEKFGVPQRRRRLVVLASRLGPAPELRPTGSGYVSVRDAIVGLPPLAAGATSDSDALHTASGLSPKNMRRIKSSRPGGTWRDWPVELRADCHRKKSGKTYSGVYARMEWDKPSPTMTTQCFGYGNGRFGHPEQDRAISLREAAILQSFPSDYKFLPPNEETSTRQLSSWQSRCPSIGRGWRRF